MSFVVPTHRTIRLRDGWGTQSSMYSTRSVKFPHLLRDVGHQYVSFLLLGVERVLRVLEELVLEFEAFIVGLDGFEGVGYLFGPGFLIEFA